ncbi:murein L,D-transpeptidase catalytic domain-containing protein [Bdellovibrio sp. HCB2-146]|uniref:murein L,D-transpeptidase catalytic domain-containing protein n=1 Tax=Bdellovibrio sp. HCB2-146 TaxID=3394362 RepID=UPI0039BCB4AC
MYTKFIFPLTLALALPLPGRAQVSVNPVYYQAGTVPAGTYLDAATANMNAYYMQMSVLTPQNTIAQMQKSMMQTQIQNQMMLIARDAFPSLMGDTSKSKKERRLRTREDQETPYYDTKLYETTPETPIEASPVPPTNQEVVEQVDVLQKSVDKVSGGQSVTQSTEDCNNEKLTRTHSYSSWEDYLKNIEATAKTAKPAISAKAVQKTLDFLRKNKERLEPKLRNRDYVVINDFTLDSTNKRMFVLDLKKKKVQRYLVSHGIGKGYPDSKKTPAMSGRDGSFETPPGFHVVENEAAMNDKKLVPFSPTKIIMDGLESRNANSRARTIVFHGGPISQDEIKRTGMLGFSKGCIQIPKQDYQDIKDGLQGGSLMYNFGSQDT